MKKLLVILSVVFLASIASAGETLWSGNKKFHNREKSEQVNIPSQFGTSFDPTAVYSATVTLYYSRLNKSDIEFLEERMSAFTCEAIVNINIERKLEFIYDECPQ